MTPDLPFRLSATAARQVNWNAIQDSTVGIADQGLEAAPPDGVTVEQTRRVFDTARREFKKALEGLRRLTRILLAVAGLLAVVAIAGAFISTIQRSFAGGAVSTVGVVALLGLFAKIHSLGRDQAMLELLPVRYEMALELASTPEDRRKILDNFLRETTSLRVGG